ncbi:MAG: hypothetical protein M1133_12255 [Armatimonadetes bacterium]|nr:hypothetical protein [Armatimonadota bacterium]
MSHIHAFPGYSTGDWFCDENTFSARLRELRRKKDDAERDYPEVQVHFMGMTSSHPEGQAQVPPVYQCQMDLEGNPREGFVCLRDKSYREILIERYRQVARAGFRRILFDDDLKDALCFCPLHLAGFSSAIGRTVSRDEFGGAFQDTGASEDTIELRKRYMAFCRETVLSLARELESAIHEISPTLRIGTCLPARRFQDLTGIACTDIINIFDTPEAPSFARLPGGEHYNALPLDMTTSVGYLIYYDELLPETYERCWETTAVGAAPCQPKGSAQMIQEGRIAEALGITPVLWAWSEEFERLHIWPGLIGGGPWPGETKPRDHGREYLGIPVYMRTGLAQELSLEEHLSDGAIKGYQALSLIGLPVRLTSDIRSDDRTICLFGFQPKTVAAEAKGWLEEGRTLVLDLPAARKLREYVPDLPDFSLAEPDARPHMEVLSGGRATDTSVAGYPIGSIAVVKREAVEAISMLRDASGNEIGMGIGSIDIGRGRIIVLPFDLCRVTFRLGKSHRDILVEELEEFASGRLPYVDGDAYLQVVLFRENGEEDLVVINYSDHYVKATARTVGVDEPIHIDLAPLGVDRVMNQSYERVVL